MHRTGGRGIYFLLILACPCDVCCPQGREEALKSRGFLLPSPPEGCSLAAAGSSPWHLGTAVWQRSSWTFVTMQYPGPGLSSTTRHCWVTLQSSNTPLKAPLLISRAFCKHQLVQAVNGVEAVDSREQLKENTPKAITAHFPNSNGHSAARERLQRGRNSV